MTFCFRDRFRKTTGENIEWINGASFWFTLKYLFKVRK